jgi:hypothetical protein
MKGEWYLGFNAEQGGEPDEVVGGDQYQGFIWQDGGGSYMADTIAIEEEDAAERVVALLNEQRAEITTLGRDLIAANTLRQQDTERRHAAERRLRAIEAAQVEGYGYAD